MQYEFTIGGVDSLGWGSEWKYVASILYLFRVFNLLSQSIPQSSIKVFEVYQQQISQTRWG